MELRPNYYSAPESIRWCGGDDYFDNRSTSSLRVPICGSEEKVKQTHKQHTKHEDVLKEFKYKKYCTPPPLSYEAPPKSTEKKCLYEPIKLAGSVTRRPH